jgi:hypothetical protein
MLEWTGAAAAAATLTGAGVLARHRVRRRRIYRELAEARARIVAAAPSLLREPLDLLDSTQTFARERVAALPPALAPGALEHLTEEALALQPLLERSFVPGHKQGGTLAYEQVQRHAPRFLALFHSPALGQAIGRVVGTPVQVTADHDQSACSVLYYTEAGDRIGWHYDHNFYRGRHFTVLLTLVNESPAGGLSSSALVYRSLDGAEQGLPTPPGTLLVFEGARIRHKVTALGPGERRVVLSMTYSTDPRIARGRELLRRVKDTGFYGVRALWD